MRLWDFDLNLLTFDVKLRQIQWSSLLTQLTTHHRKMRKPFQQLVFISLTHTTYRRIQHEKRSIKSNKKWKNGYFFLEHQHHLAIPHCTRFALWERLKSRQSGFFHCSLSLYSLQHLTQPLPVWSERISFCFLFLKVEQF